MYIFNMVQHTKTGEVVSEPLTFASIDGWKAKYHHEMDYAISNEDLIGLSVLVTNMSLDKVFYDNWARETTETTEATE